MGQTLFILLSVCSIWNLITFSPGTCQEDSGQNRNTFLACNMLYNPNPCLVIYRTLKLQLSCDNISFNLCSLGGILRVLTCYWWQNYIKFRVDGKVRWCMYIECLDFLPSVDQPHINLSALLSFSVWHITFIPFEI